MSLWSSLLETYDQVQSIAGVIPLDELHKQDVDKAFLPLYHTSLKTNLCVTLNADGTLVGIERDLKEVTIIVPCTERSMSRSGKQPQPHPLCDQVQYMDDVYGSSRVKQYLTQLASWKADNIKLNAIYNYLQEHSVVHDAGTFGIHLYSPEDIQSENTIDAESVDDRRTMDDKEVSKRIDKDRKIGVRFSVEVPGDRTPHVWQDRTIRDLWISHEQGSGRKIGVDLLGKDLYSAADSFPKKIVSAAGNAKLISTNDTTNFTYRGRFVSSSETLQIDKSTSQKIHSTLSWLVRTNGTATLGQVIVIWAISNKPSEVLNPFGDSFDVFEQLSDVVPISDRLAEANIQVDANYATLFRNLLRGYGKPEAIKQHNRNMVIAVFDAATTGRLSVTFYREMAENEYLENVLQWHVDSAWHLIRFETVTDASEGKKTQSVAYIGAPSYRDVIECAFVTDDHSSQSYKRYSKDVQRNLVECMFGNRSLPDALLWSAFHRVTRPMSFSSESTWHRREATWRRYFEVACSMWKKHFIQEGTTVTMELDTSRTDRDYLYGRLLALADDFESEILYRQGIAGTRPTNAVKLMSNFAAKPFSTWGSLWKQLTPYLKSAKGNPWFQDRIDEVMSLFQPGDFESNAALSPLFLLGYSSERRTLRKRFIEKHPDSTKTTEENDNSELAEQD